MYNKHMNKEGYFLKVLYLFHFDAFGGFQPSFCILDAVGKQQHKERK